MIKSERKKICIVATSLGSGGAEKSSALLSEMLHQLGHEIYIVTVLNDITYEFKGTLFNLGELKDKNDTVLGRISRLFKFRRFLKKHQFDVVIDNRTRPSFFREIVISKLIYQAKKTIYCVRSFNLDLYFIPNKSIARYIYKDSYKMIGVSKEISKKIRSEFNLSNVETIYNPVPNFKLVDAHNEDERPYVLFFGRLDDAVKNIILLLEAYKISKLPEVGIALKILGNGPDATLLKQKVETFGLQSYVEFLPFTQNPEHIIKSSRFTVLTSRFEGFPRAVIESLVLGIPVVAVDCQSGPKEVITNAYNGLLVENYNPQALADAMNSFIFDEELYKTCKANAAQSVKQFSLEHIAKDWQKLLNGIDEK